KHHTVNEGGRLGGCGSGPSVGKQQAVWQASRRDGTGEEKGGERREEVTGPALQARRQREAQTRGGARGLGGRSSPGGAPRPSSGGDRLGGRGQAYEPMNDRPWGPAPPPPPEPRPSPSTQPPLAQARGRTSAEPRAEQQAEEEEEEEMQEEMVLLVKGEEEEGEEKYEVVKLKIPVDNKE
ncbi:hypothetical protein U0070_004532, partial [Myodes glareolus]